MSKTVETTKETAKPVEKTPSGIAPRRGFFPFLTSFTPREFFSMNPFEMMRQFTDEMDKMFEPTGYWKGFKLDKPWAPAIEVFQKEGKFTVRAELPGLTKEDVKVELTDNGLVIRGERKEEKEEKEKDFYRSEMNYGSFYRYIPVPENALFEQIEAKFNNGILEVFVPVAETEVKKREVPITEGAKATAATK